MYIVIPIDLNNIITAKHVKYNIGFYSINSIEVNSELELLAF
jgi:hypothetical protein